MKVLNIALYAILVGDASAKWYDALQISASEWPGYFYREINPTANGLAITTGSESIKFNEDQLELHEIHDLILQPAARTVRKMLTAMHLL